MCALLASIFACCFCCGGAFAETSSDGETVYLGGFPIGISLDIGGLLVESVIGVETEYGIAAVEGIMTGDIIKKIDGQEVNSADGMTEILTSSPTEIELVRDGQNITVTVKPVIEAYSLKPKLGIKIKDTIYGVGTVTYVSKDGRFTALGHEISSETGAHIPFAGGHVHACKVVGVKRGSKTEAGALLASLSPEKVYGTVSCNNSFGIAGAYDCNDCEFYKNGECVKIAKRDEVRPGAAKIRTDVSGSPEYYDVEIIKATKQSGRKEKGLILRVTDKRLLDLTGGVVRGMSGSPILQGGKLVGAVTHVFLNDHTKGYGVYADCLN